MSIGVMSRSRLPAKNSFSGLARSSSSCQLLFDAFAHGTNTSSTNSVKSLLPAARLYLSSKISRLIFVCACSASALVRASGGLQAGISGFRFHHDLRHTFATRLRAKGVHEMDIMTLLGHTTLQMTSRYTHAMPQNLRTAVDSLNKEPLPFRPKASSAKSAPRSRQVATGTDGN